MNAREIADEIEEIGETTVRKRRAAIENRYRRQNKEAFSCSLESLLDFMPVKYGCDGCE